MRRMARADQAAIGDWPSALEVIPGAMNAAFRTHSAAYPFPDGQLVCEVDARIVACARARKVRGVSLDPASIAVDGGASVEPAEDGDTLLGLGIWDSRPLTAPAASHLTTLHSLARSNLVRRLGLRQWAAFCPLPDFMAWAGAMSVEGYVQQVQAGAIVDRALSFHLRLGGRVGAIFPSLGPQAAPVVLVLCDKVRFLDRGSKRACSAGF